MSIPLSVSFSLFLCFSVHICIYCTSILWPVCLYLICVFIYLSLYLYVYVFTHTYICIFSFMYIYASIERERQRDRAVYSILRNEDTTVNEPSVLTYSSQEGFALNKHTLNELQLWGVL